MLEHVAGTNGPEKTQAGLRPQIVTAPVNAPTEIQFITVIFQPDNMGDPSLPFFDFLDVNGNPVQTIVVPGGTTGYLVFDLQLAPGHAGSLEFIAQPIQFAAVGGMPLLPIPPCFEVQRDTGIRLTVIDVNTNTSGAKEEFGFYLTVLYEGRIYGSTDPTIVNDPIPPS